MRYAGPVLFVCAAVGVYVYNQEPSRQVVLPMLHMVVGPDMFAQGRLTWQIMLGLGILTGGLTLLSDLRRKPRTED